MKKILIIPFLLLFITSFSQQGRKAGRKNFYGTYQFFDTVYFQKIPYSASASIVHLGIDTLVSSPTFGKLVRKTAGGAAALTSTYVGYGSGGNTLTGSDRMTYDQGSGVFQLFDVLGTDQQMYVLGGSGVYGVRMTGSGFGSVATGHIQLLEQSAPSTPASSNSVLYVKTDGLFYGKDDAGTETGLSANIYNTNGTLTGFRTVTAGANTLVVTGSENTVNITTSNGASEAALVASASNGGGYAFSFFNSGGATNSVTDIGVIQVQTTGTAANGIGVGIPFQVENTANSAVDVGKIIYRLRNATNATRTGDFSITNVVNAITDTAIRVGDYVTLTESAATKFTSTTIATGKIQGGSMLVTVEGNDATDFQSRTLRFIWSAVNKAGTLTITLSTPEEVVAISNGSTLTATITAVDAGSGNLDFKINAVSSLTQTTLRATYQTFKNF